MKAFMLFALCYTILISACVKDADLAAPAELPSADLLKSYASELSAIAGSEDPGLTKDYCIELQTSNWLSGFGTYEPLRQTAAQDLKVSRISSGLYVIEAKGDGVSEDYARSSSELKCTFNARTNRLTGTMITTFFYGEVLEQKFDGEALVIFDQSAMILKANVNAAQFNTGSETLYLVEGEILLALPMKLEGWLETNIYTKGMFCTAAIN